MNIIMCRSLTYAQRASSVLERSGITASIARAPQELTDRGCGYCVKVSPRRFHEALAVLARAGVPHEVHVFDQGGHGLSMANVNTRTDNEAEQAVVRPWFDLACAFLTRRGVA